MIKRHCCVNRLIAVIGFFGLLGFGLSACSSSQQMVAMPIQKFSLPAVHLTSAQRQWERCNARKAKLLEWGVQFSQVGEVMRVRIPDNLLFYNGTFKHTPKFEQRMNILSEFLHCYRIRVIKVTGRAYQRNRWFNSQAFVLRKAQIVAKILCHKNRSGRLIYAVGTVYDRGDDSLDKKTRRDAENGLYTIDIEFKYTPHFIRKF